MTTLRLAVDAASLVRDRRGMGRLARDVLAAMRESPGLDVTLLAASARDRIALAREFGTWARVAPATAARRRDRFDLVFFPFNGMRFGVAAPAVAFVHDAFAFTEAHPERIARAREQRPIRRTAREARAILTTTFWCRDEIARELPYPAGLIAVVPPVPDASFIAAPARPEGSRLAEDRFVLAVGGTEGRKNLPMLVEAAARALRAPERLVVAGAASRELVERARRRGLRLDVVTPADDELRELYRTAAIVAVPSRAEGFGLVAVEAMACGAAVLAADGSGLREATRGSARLLPADDAALWAAELRRLLDDAPGRRALAERGRRCFDRVDRAAFGRGVVALLCAIAEATR